MSHSLKTIRLINFHNLVDAEIPVQGHLFLVGDNASGKTTVLDAVQWVLSGNQDLEFNAAASLGGKQEGRDLRGAVLRYDIERGVQRTKRTITYAALELADENGKILTIGLGAELAHPEAQLDSWGFVHTGPLEEVPLLKSSSAGNGDSAPRPITKEELREALGQEKVFFQIGRYRKNIALRLTRGETDFARLTHFWKISKAYKQIAQGTRDYSQILRQMLPAPTDDVFQEMAKGLTDLEGIEIRLGGLREQTRYLDRLREWLKAVIDHREAIARYTYLAIYRDRQSLNDERAALDAALEQARQEQAAMASNLGKARADLARREAELQDLRRKDQEGLLERRSSLQRELALAEHQHKDAQKIVGEISMEIARAAKQLAKERREFVLLVRPFIDRLEALLNDVGGDEGRRFLTALKDFEKAETPELAWAVLDARRAQEETLRRQKELGENLQQVQYQLREARANRDKLKEERDALEKITDPLPDIPGYAECLRRLAQEGLAAAPFYSVLEKASQADEQLFRDLEAALGERVLAALVPEPVDAAQVARLILHEFPGIAVVRTDLPVPERCPSLEKLVQWDRLTAEAKGYLSRLVGNEQSPNLRLEGEGLAEERGARLRLKHRAGPLIGAEARRAFHRQRLQKVTDELAKAEDGVRRSELETHRIQKQFEAAGALLSFWTQIYGRDVAIKQQHCLEMKAQEARLRERHERAKEDAAKQQTLIAVHSRALENLRLRLEEQGLHDLEARIIDVEASLQQVQSEMNDLNRKQGGLEQKTKDLHLSKESLDAKLKETEERLAKQAQTLTPFVPEEYRSDLDRYVWEVRQGQRFTRSQNVQEKLREEERALGGVIANLRGDGGLTHPHYGGLFGFAYDEGENRITDRKGDSLEKLLEGFAAQVSECEALVDEKRQKLFQEIIVGHLARRLREQVMSLEETVRGVNRQLSQQLFGRKTRYKILVKQLPDHARFIASIKQLGTFVPASQEEFQEEVRQRLKSLAPEGAALPAEFDYRYWYEFQPWQHTYTDEGVALDSRLMKIGSGGEQAVPKYLMVLAMASLLFKMTEARIPILLFDEVFYGVDPGRREELLALATELGLQLVVASPEQTGDSERYKQATTVFMVKDDASDVHMIVHKMWIDPRKNELCLPENGSIERTSSP